MTLVTELVRELKPVRRPARVLYWGAAFWLASALVHLVALAADNWAWAGAVSFRKPLVFSLSIGLLLATSGWVLDRLPDRPRLPGVLAWTFLISSTIEVGLIALQAWRGRASHFNTFEAGDSVIFITMGMMVGVMSICLLTLLIWSIARRPADPLVRVAVIAGLALVATGLGFGQWIITLGSEFVATQGEVPETVIYGEAGVVKFPHAIAFHGIQFFIVLSVLLHKGSHTGTARKRIMWAAVIAYSGILVFASAQTIVGQSPLQPGIWSLGLVLSVIGCALTGALAIRGLSDVRKNLPVA